jgi:hypothetical protein
MICAVTRKQTKALNMGGEKGSGHATPSFAEGKSSEPPTHKDSLQVPAPVSSKKFGQTPVSIINVLTRRKKS